MWRTVSVVVAIAVLPCVSCGFADNEVASVERRLAAFEIDLDGVESDNQAQIHHRSHHHREHRSGPRRKRFLGLLKRGADAEKPPAGLEAKLLPGRHPDVTRKVHSMEPELHSLDDSKHIAAQVRSNLEGEVIQAIHHMDSVVSIKKQLAMTEVAIRSEERELKKLEADRLHLDATHQDLSASLRHVMEPKIAFAQARLDRKRRELVKLQDREAEWKTKEDEYHASSLAMLEERRQSKDRLEAAAQKEHMAHAERKAAEKQLRATQSFTTHNIQAYQYSKAKGRASTSKEKQGEEEEKQAEVSVNRLNHILAMEQRRVDESMAIGKDRVNGKIQKLEGVQKDSVEKVAKLKTEYGAWQATQESWASQLASSQHSTDAASKHFGDMQDKMLTSAQDQVVSDAVGASDWTGWDEWPGQDSDRGIP